MNQSNKSMVRNTYCTVGKMGLHKKTMEEFNQLDLSIKALIQDIRECSRESDVETISHKIRCQMKKSKELIETLENIAFETAAKDDLEEMVALAAVFRHTLERNRQTFRDAILTANVKKFSEDRAELFNSHEDKVDSLRKRKHNEVIQQTHTISNNLTSVSRLLSEQVEKSSNALSLLGSSSNVIRDVKEELNIQGSEATSGKSLVTKFKRRAFTDQILVGLAYAFFFLCAFYVFFKRL